MIPKLSDMDLTTYISRKRGSATDLAAAIGVSPSYLSQMVRGKSPISPERCVEIEKATGGEVTRKNLRPDDWDRIWPELVPDPVQNAHSAMDPGLAAPQ